jgi:glucose/arabinose dehydrogenase
VRLRTCLLLLSIGFITPTAIPSTGLAASDGIGAVPIVTGLSFPAAFTFSPDGRIFYAQQWTKIRVFDPSTHKDSLFFRIPDVSKSGGQGLLGLAIDPGYPSKPFVYAYVTRYEDGTPFNEIIKIRDDGGTGASMRVIFSLEPIPAGMHNGGRILFGPDRHLYAVTGDVFNAGNSQDFSNDVGKVLRLDRQGAAPPNNPFPGSRIWAYGIRNSFGLAFDPSTGYMWETEAGPECNDEVNLIGKGANYGWGPHKTCSSPPPPPLNTNQDGPKPTLPLAWFTPTLPRWAWHFARDADSLAKKGTCSLADYNNGDLHDVVLTADRRGISSMTVVYHHSDFLLSMERGPDGGLYFSDSSGIFKLVDT